MFPIFQDYLTKVQEFDLAEIILALEMFIEIGHQVQDNFAIIIGWRAFDYSLRSGLALNWICLLKLWDMSILQKSPILPFIANYLMERPTVDRRYLGERLAITLDIAYKSKPEIICAMLPALLSWELDKDLR